MCVVIEVHICYQALVPKENVARFTSHDIVTIKFNTKTYLPYNNFCVLTMKKNLFCFFNNVYINYMCVGQKMLSSNMNSLLTKLISL